MKRIVLISKWLPVLVAVLLTAWTFSVLSHSDFQDIPLTDTQADSHGWSRYEIRTGPEEAVPVIPRYHGEGYELSDESYDAVRRSRVMAEEELYATEPKLQLDYGECGVELLLDGQLFYSDFQTALRDSNGFLVLDEDDFAAANNFRTIEIGLPMEYMGKTLTMIVYYPFADTWGVVVPPAVSGGFTMLAMGMTGGVPPMLWQVFWGVMMVVVAVGCAGSMNPASSRSLRAKYVLLLIMYVVFFIVNAYNSEVGFYSGFSGWIDRLVSRVPFRIYSIWPILLLCALLLLGPELWERGQKKWTLPAGWTVLFALVGLWVDAMQGSSELGGCGDICLSYSKTYSGETGCQWWQ